MDFGLTEEQVLIRESARRFTEEHASPQAVFDRGAWSTLAELGFLSLGLPERFGGVGGPVELSLVCREFGRGPLPQPYVGAAVFAARLIIEAGSEAQQHDTLTALSEGTRIISVAYRDSTEAIARGPTTFRREGSGFVLDGQKRLAIAAPVADQLIVTAAPARPEDDRTGPSLFLVDTGTAGVRVVPVPLVDGGWCGEVYFDEVRLGAESLLGQEGEGAETLKAGLRYAILGSASQTAGAMERALHLASGYLRTRRQFGAPLSSFQALRHKIADMTIDCEMADAAILKMIASFQSPGQHDPEEACALAKAILDEAGHRVCSQAIQIHGGMGMTEECGVGQYFRLVTLNKALFGSTTSHVEHYTNLLSARVAGLGDETP
jgi:alkylation response protein AidB-like acyl-CoA dehydrogenase